MAYTKLGPGTLTLGEDTAEMDLSCQVTSMTMTPETDTEDPLVVLCGDTIPGGDTTTWTLEGTLVTDLTSTGFVKWVWDNAGTVVPFTYTPSNEVGTSFAGQVKVGYIPIGGDVNTTMTSEISWSMIGAPTPTFSDEVESTTYPSQLTYPSAKTYPTMSVKAPAPAKAPAKKTADKSADTATK